MGYEVSGLLGFHLLRNFFLDLNYRDGLVQMIHDQNRLYMGREFDKTNPD
jgi:hypothetical protein